MYEDCTMFCECTSMNLILKANIALHDSIPASEYIIRSLYEVLWMYIDEFNFESESYLTWQHFIAKASHLKNDCTEIVRSFGNVHQWI